MLHNEFESYHEAYLDLTNLMAEIESLNIALVQNENATEIKEVTDESIKDNNTLNEIDLNDNAAPQKQEMEETANTFDVNKTFYHYSTLLTKSANHLAKAIHHFYDADDAYYTEHFEIISRACLHYSQLQHGVEAMKLLYSRLSSNKEHQEKIALLLIYNGAANLDHLNRKDLNGYDSATLLLKAIEFNHSHELIQELIQLVITPDLKNHDALHRLLAQQNEFLAAKILQLNPNALVETHKLFPETKDDEENIDLVYFKITKFDGTTELTDRMTAHLTLLRAMAILEKEEKCEFDYTPQDKKIFLFNIRQQILYVRQSQKDASLCLRELLQIYDNNINSSCLNYIRHMHDWLANKVGIATYTTSRIEFLMMIQNLVIDELLIAWETNHADICKLINLVQSHAIFSPTNLPYSPFKNVSAICAAMREGKNVIPIEQSNSTFHSKTISDEDFAGHLLNPAREPRANLVERFPDDNKVNTVMNNKTTMTGLLSSLGSYIKLNTASKTTTRPITQEPEVEMKTMAKKKNNFSQ